MLCRLRTLGITVNRKSELPQYAEHQCFKILCQRIYYQYTPMQIHTNVIELYTLYTYAMRVPIGKTNFCRRILKSGINIRSKSKSMCCLGWTKTGKVTII